MARSGRSHTASIADIIGLIISSKIRWQDLKGLAISIIEESMRSYNKQNLQQCVKNLFAQARYEFKAIHNIECKFKIAVGEGMTKSKVLSLWDNDGDCFYATALELIRLNYDSKIMIDLSVYVKYSDYTCSCAMSCKQ